MGGAPRDRLEPLELAGDTVADGIAALYSRDGSPQEFADMLAVAVRFGLCRLCQKRRPCIIDIVLGPLGEREEWNV